MAMEWVLIIYFNFRAGGISVDFTTKEKCEIAAAKIREEVVKKAWDSAYTICTPK